jgi:hypothetical protein
MHHWPTHGEVAGTNATDIPLKDIIMSTSTAEMSAHTSVYSTSAFWERLWRLSGINSIAFFVIAYVVYGYQPLVAAIFAGIAILNLMWFVAALRTTLADMGKDGWGAAATASSAILGALFLLITTSTAAADSTAHSGNPTLISGLNDFAWASVVLSSFPRAMLIMAGTFGFWRARLISNTEFAAGVAAVVLVLLGGTTWLSDGFWSPDGVYSRVISPLIGLVWIVGASGVLLARSPATRTGW